MQLTATIILAAAFLAAPEEATKSSTVPTTIGMYTRYSHGWARDDDPVDHVLMLVAACQEGKWLPSAFFAMATPEDRAKLAETFRPEQESFLDTLMTQTFHLCSNPATTFTPEKKKIPWIVEQQYIGLAGTLNGKIEEKEACSALIMTNVQGASASLESGALSKKDTAFFSKRLKKLISTAVRQYESERPKDSQRPVFDPKYYHSPEYKTVMDVKLPGGWEGRWLHATLDYPVEKSVKALGFTERAFWSGYYDVLVEAGPASEKRILWEYATFLGREVENRYYRLKGVFDLDKNNIPEFLLEVGGWEYHAYLFTHAKNGELAEISSVFGAL